MKIWKTKIIIHQVTAKLILKFLRLWLKNWLKANSKVRKLFRQVIQALPLYIKSKESLKLKKLATWKREWACIKFLTILRWHQIWANRERKQYLFRVFHQSNHNLPQFKQLGREEWHSSKIPEILRKYYKFLNKGIWKSNQIIWTNQNQSISIHQITILTRKKLL
jgi:hypothetical protein